MAVIGNLKAILTADISGFLRGMKDVTGSLKTLDSTSDTAGSAFSRLGAKVITANQALELVQKGYRAVAGAIGPVIEATLEAERVDKLLESQLKATGGAVGFTADQLKAFASELQSATTVGDEEIKELQTTLLAFRNISGDTFKRTTRAVLDFATVTGRDATTAARTLGVALNDPATGMSRLRQAGISLGQSTQDLIKSLVAQGKATEAQNVLLGELEKSYGGAAEAARDTLGGSIKGLQNAFGDLLEAPTGSISSVTVGINELTSVLEDPAFKQFASDTLGAIAQGFAGLIRPVADFGKGLAESARALKEGAAAEESFGRLEVAIARAAARGQELTQAQRQAVLAGASFVEVFGEGVIVTDKFGKEAAQTAPELKKMGLSADKAADSVADLNKVTKEIASKKAKIELEIDTAALSDAEKKARAFGLEIEQAALKALQTEEAARAMGQAAAEQTLPLIQLAEKTTRLFSDLRGFTEGIATEIQGLSFVGPTASLDLMVAKLRQARDEGILTFKEFDQRVGEVTASFKKLQDAQAKGIFKGLEEEFRKIDASAEILGKSLTDLGTKKEILAKKADAVRAALLEMAAKGLDPNSKEAKKLRDELERLEAQMGKLEGATEDATKNLEKFAGGVNTLGANIGDIPRLLGEAGTNVQTFGEIADFAAIETQFLNDVMSALASGSIPQLNAILQAGEQFLDQYGESIHFVTGQASGVAGIISEVTSRLGLQRGALNATAGAYNQLSTAIRAFTNNQLAAAAATETTTRAVAEWGSVATSSGESIAKAIETDLQEATATLRRWSSSSSSEAIVSVKASGSPTLSFSDYFTKYIPKVLEGAASGVPSLTFPTAFDGAATTAGEDEFTASLDRVELLLERVVALGAGNIAASRETTRTLSSPGFAAATSAALDVVSRVTRGARS